MARIAAWLRACGSDDSVHAEIRAKLEAGGIDLSPFQESVKNPPFGIICFDQMTDEIFSLLGRLRSDLCRILIVSMSAPESALPVWRLLDAGACDVLVWDKGGVVAAQICAKLQRWSAVDGMISEASSRGCFVGQSHIWRELVRKVVEAARFTRAPILLTGESGTGKELLARLISVLTPAADAQGEVRQELVTVDCGALTTELSGSEFFGHERGAFTGAHTMRDGAFALADGATLLLDEIGEIPLTLQPQILRAIQEKTYKRLGSNVWQKSDFRLVSATNRDLKDMANRGNFRFDLYYRIAGCVFSSPPLRDRRDDILPLASHFLSEILPAPVPEFDSHLREYLLNRAYAGNVRELRRLIQRIAIRYPGTGPVTAGDLPEEDRPARQEPGRIWPDDRFDRTISDAVALGISLKEISQTAVQTAIRTAVNSENGNLRRAAARLGVTDRAIQMRRAAGQLGHQPSPRASLSAKFDRMSASQPRGDRPHIGPHGEVV